jgi:hypothetical protein
LALKVIFWTVDISAVVFCHKIKFISRMLGEKTWKMFIFKLFLVAVPLQFLNNIENSAKEIFNEETYKQIRKLYRRYKQTGDMLDLND